MSGSLPVSTNLTRVLFLGLLLCGLPASGLADVLHLTGGGRLEGIVVSESAARVTLEVSSGRVTLPRSQVAGIERTESALATFRARLAATAPGDNAALVSLGRFATFHGLSAEARAVWTRVLDLDPGNAEAHRALGHVMIGGSWLEPEQAYRAQGLIPFEGRWVTPAEEDAALRARDREQEQERRAVEDRRVEEARRIAREAEERARRAEADAAQLRNSPWGYGLPVVISRPGWGGGSGCLRLPCDRESPAPRPSPTPAPTPAPVRVHPSSIR